MTQGELDDLRKLCDDAHVGPWKACGSNLLLGQTTKPYAR